MCVCVCVCVCVLLAAGRSKKALMVGLTNVSLFCVSSSVQHNSLNVTFPLLTPSLRAETLALTVRYLRVYNSHPIAVKRILAGRLVFELLAAIDAVLDGTSTLKLLHYSAHDSTVQPMLVALGVFDGTPVPYAGHIQFELRFGASRDPASATVVTRYQDQVLVLPFCNGLSVCPYQSVFRPALTDFAVPPGDTVMASLCVPLTPKPAPAPTASSTWSGLEITLVILCSVFAILLMVQHMRHAKATSASTSPEPAHFTRL